MVCISRAFSDVCVHACRLLAGVAALSSLEDVLANSDMHACRLLLALSAAFLTLAVILADCNVHACRVLALVAVVLILAGFLADSDVHPCRLLAVVAALLSLAIVVAEATISPYLPNLSIFSRALHHTSGNELATELLAFVSLVGTYALSMRYPYSVSARPSQICAKHHACISNRATHRAALLA